MWRKAWTLLFIAPSLLPAYVTGSATEKWGDPVFGTPGGTVTWSIAPAGPGVGGYPYVSLDSFVPDGFASHLQWAFDQWSAVANIQFVQVPDNGAPVATDPDAGVIRITGIHLPAGTDVLAQTSGPIGPLSESQFAFASTLRFSDNFVWSFSDGQGYNFDRVALHEVGHLLGLQHTPASTPGVMNLYYGTALPLGLLADDIAGAQFLYGAPVPEAGLSYLTALLVLALATAVRKS